MNGQTQTAPIQLEGPGAVLSERQKLRCAKIMETDPERRSVAYNFALNIKFNNSSTEIMMF